MDAALDNFNSKLKEQKLDGFIITNPVNIFYLTGFKGVSPTERESILILTPKPVLIVPRLYQNEAKKLESKTLKVEIVEERHKLYEVVAKLFTNTANTPGVKSSRHPDYTPGVKSEKNLVYTPGVKRVGFEEENLKYSEYQELKKLLTGLVLVPVKNLVEDLRLYKSNEELAKIEKAQIISQRAFESLAKTIEVGQTEEEITDHLAKIIKELGGNGLAFESIVASGQNSALPHHVTGNRELETRDTLLIDFGAKFQNYCADISRTIFIGKPTDEKMNIYNLVAQAQKEAIDIIKHGTSAKNAHETAHSVFKKEKLDRYFLHGLGHGVGLEVHEAPHLRRKGADILEEGMVFSIEPGLYFPSWGGVRIEDLVTIKNGKARVLGKLQREMIIL